MDNNDDKQEQQNEESMLSLNQKVFWHAIDNVNEDEIRKQEEKLLEQRKIQAKEGGHSQAQQELIHTIQRATELGVWLHTEFQCKMEEADALMAKEAADEKKPYAEKYQARELLMNLKMSDYLSEKYTKLPKKSAEDAENLSENDSQVSQSEGSDVMRCALGLIMHKLGINYYDTEEASDALAYLEKSFELMDSIPDNFKLRHLNVIQDLYNHIAIVLSERERAEEALKMLQRAEEIYKLVVEHTKDLPQKSILNNFDLYLLKQTKGKGVADGKGDQIQDAHFSFYINSGLDLKKLETRYTQTLFILAQVYSKLGNVEQGMNYCALTMKRQLSQNEYEIKDWVQNATTLADAFLSKDHYAQAEYLLYAAYHVLPDDQEKHAEQRAMTQMQLGRYYQKLLEVGTAMFLNGQELILEKVQQKFVEFPELEMKWPMITNMKNLDDAKTLFRLANTQFKRALEFYVLDGFVTENVLIKQSMSQLYRHLLQMEPSDERKEMMFNRRKEMLEALQSELNPQHYQIRMMEFGAELSEIYSDIYDLEWRKKKKSLEAINAAGKKSIENANAFTSIIYKKDDPADKYEYVTSMLNLELSVTSKLTKWVTQDPRERIDKTKEAYEIYLRIDKFVKDWMQYKKYASDEDIPEEAIRQQINIINEMIQLLPPKLDKMCSAIS